MIADNDLIKLVNENPGTRIVPFVAREVVNPDWAYNLGSFDCWSLEEIITDPYDDEHILIKSQDYADFEYNYYECDNEKREEIPEEEIKKAWNNLDWEKVILAYIEMP